MGATSPGPSSVWNPRRIGYASDVLISRVDAVHRRSFVGSPRPIAPSLAARNAGIRSFMSRRLSDDAEWSARDAIRRVKGVLLGVYPGLGIADAPHYGCDRPSKLFNVDLPVQNRRVAVLASLRAPA